jgi:thymidylate synthase (FAD)
MILVKPSATILSVSVYPLQLIEEAGRTCYKSEDKITHESAPIFVAAILKRQHESVIEHASATVRFVCDRGVSHEIVRHRLASYSQESTRYCDYHKGEVTFVIPPWICIDENKRGTNTTSVVWLEAMESAETSYKYLRAFGWKPEQARAVLPNSLKTELVMTANLREWRHFFRLRTAPAAHPQMREVAIPLLLEMQHRIPVVFDDIKTQGE